MTAPKNVSSRTPSSWEPQDDVLLRHLKEVKRLGWKEIAQYFTNRTPNACQFRWRRLKSGSLKTVKSPEDEDEDDEILDVAVPAIAPVAAALEPALSADSASNGGTNAVSSATLASTPASTTTGRKTTATSTSGARKSGSAGPMPMPMPIPTSKVTNSAVLSSPHGLTGVGLGGFVSSASAAVTPGSSVPSVNGGLAHSGSLSKSPFSTAPHGKFIKPRSASHSQDVAPNVHHFNDQEENFGFIPKVFIKSRRGSAVVVNNPIQPNLAVSSSNLTSSKSRKNSFSSRSRRSSFNVASDRHFIPMSSNGSSRRSSVVVMPPSTLPTSSSHPRRESFTTNGSMSRSNSVSQFRRGSMQAGFIDMPTKQSSQPPPSTVPTVGSFNGFTKPWSIDEDKLLVEKRQRYHLSIDELSILLPHRFEQEIQWRIEMLQLTAADAAANNAPVVSVKPDSSPLADDVHSTYSPDTAIDEHDGVEDDEEDVDVEIVGRMDDSVAPTRFKEESPAFSQTSSTGSSARERSPVFSPDAHSLKDQSPTISDGNHSSFYGGRIPSSVPKHIRQTHATSEQNPQFTPSSSQSQSPPPQNHRLPQLPTQPLPSLNTIFKHIV
ncbi:unnamed protein product [Kluyveromyces dobzhanskii CBS 2104]|uniref:WGS project CCBQ000000000 data, contig 00011 n=1 Tax=Kluyveromyces dobzhanskii CBS 2104 TaxID=1427455 RepID=A0A0A8L9Y6_9SACH|nr:unnamed protein product [Kluyveromyces dobzhanskii CBS 2104]